MTFLTVPDECAMLELGRLTCKDIHAGCIVFLSGEPGAGKTIFARGVLNGFGHQGMVTSPTYTLVETYDPGERTIHHFDFYRIESPVELEMMGIRDMMTETAISLIEWPDRGAGVLPKPDLEVRIEYSGQGRSVDINNHQSPESA